MMLRLHNNIYARLVFGLVVISVLGWAIVSTGVANHLAQRSPTTALWLQSENSDALDYEAARLILGMSGPRDQSIAAAMAAAKKSLRKDATSGVAYRVLGFGYDARAAKERARFLVRFASGSTRRDLPTNLWMINDLVRRNDAAGALRYFDAALRTTTDATSILFPVLTDALIEPSLVDPIAAILNRRPPWAADFLSLAVENVRSEENVGRLLARIDPASGLITQRLVDQFIRRMYREGHVAQAARLSHSGEPPEIFLNGNFDRSSRDIPFEWQPSASTDRSSWRDEVATGQTVLRFSAEPGANGALGSQQIFLLPGTYTLSFISGEGSWETGHPPNILLRCTALDGSLLRTNLELAGYQSATFEIGGACQLITFEILVHPQEELTGVAGWIDKITIRPTGHRSTDKPPDKRR